MLGGHRESARGVFWNCACSALGVSGSVLVEYWTVLAVYLAAPECAASVP